MNYQCILVLTVLFRSIQNVVPATIEVYNANEIQSPELVGLSQGGLLLYTLLVGGDHGVRIELRYAI